MFNMGKEKVGKRNIVNTVANVMVLSIFVKIIGFVKQAVVAAIYGSTQQTDIYFITSEFLTNIGTALFAALTVVIIPAYVQKKKERKTNDYISKVLIAFLLITLGMIVVVEIFSNPISSLLASGYGPNEILEVTHYLRIMSPVLLFMCFVNIFQAVLEGEKRFVPSKSIGIIQSIVVISIAVILGIRYGTRMLVAGFILSAILEFIYLLLFVRRYYQPKRVRNLFDNEIKNLIKKMLPLCIGNAVADISVIVDKIIATELGEGVASALSYGQTLKSFVATTLITTSVSVIFVYFSDYVAEGATEKVQDLFEKALSISIILMIPVSIISYVCSNDIVAMIYQRGNFDGNDTRITGLVLQGYAVGFVPLAIRNILVRVHYAFRDTKWPMINGIIAIFCNIILSIVLGRTIGVIGITIATSFSYFVSMLLLLISIRKYIANYSKKNILLLILKGIPATLICILGTCLLQRILILPLAVKFIMIVITIFVAYFVVLHVLRCNELNFVWDMLKDMKGRKRNNDQGH